MSTQLFAQAVSEACAPAEFLDSVIQSSTEYSIIAKDLDGNVVLWNEGASRLYGYHSGEVVGIANVSVLHPAEDNSKIASVLAAARRDTMWSGQVQRVRKSGERFAAQVVITPRYDAERRFVGYLMISHPVAGQ